MDVVNPLGDLALFQPFPEPVSLRRRHDDLSLSRGSDQPFEADHGGDGRGGVVAGDRSEAVPAGTVQRPPATPGPIRA